MKYFFLTLFPFKFYDGVGALCVSDTAINGDCQPDTPKLSCTDLTKFSFIFLGTKIVFTGMSTVHVFLYHCSSYLSLDFEKSGALAKEYSTTKGPGTTAKPETQLFFRKIGMVVKTTLEKCERENGFM